MSSIDLIYRGYFFFSQINGNQIITAVGGVLNSTSQVYQNVPTLPSTFPVKIGSSQALSANDSYQLYDFAMYDGILTSRLVNYMYSYLLVLYIRISSLKQEHHAKKILNDHLLFKSY